MAPSDPLHIAEDENEQGPEENGDDSSPDKNYNLHVGPVTWSLSERKKGRKSVLDAKGLKTHTHTQLKITQPCHMDWSFTNYRGH